MFPSPCRDRTLWHATASRRHARSGRAALQLARRATRAVATGKDASISGQGTAWHPPLNREYYIDLAGRSEAVRAREGGFSSRSTGVAKVCFVVEQRRTSAGLPFNPNSRYHNLPQHFRSTENLHVDFWAHRIQRRQPAGQSRVR